MTSFQTYLIGFIVLIVGLGIGAYLLGLPPVWIAVGVIVLIGIGIISASGRDNTRDQTRPPPPDGPTY